MKPLLTIEAIIIALWDAGCILLGDTYDTRYNQANPEAPPSPLRINIRIAPNGLLARQFVFEVGRHMADVLLQRNSRPQFQGIFGIPNAGNVLMEGFHRQWAQNLHPFYLDKFEDESGRHFRLSVPEYEQPPWVHDIWAVDDLVTSLLTKEAAIAAMKKPVRGISVVINRSPDAEERLAAKGIMLSASADVSSMLAYLVSAQRIHSDRAIAVEEKVQQFYQYQREHPVAA